MTNNFFGRSNGGHERRSDGSCSRKRKKNYNSEKPNKQPKRGLGVAQLERIRLHGEMAMGYDDPSLYIPHHPPNCTNEGFRVPTAGCSSMSTSSLFAHSTLPFAESNGFHRSITTGFAEYERANRFSDDLPESSHHARWSAGITNLEGQPFNNRTTSNIILNLQEKDLQLKKRHRSDSIGSSNQHSRSSDYGEIDLELRL